MTSRANDATISVPTTHGVLRRLTFGASFSTSASLTQLLRPIRRLCRVSPYPLQSFGHSGFSPPPYEGGVAAFRRRGGSLPTLSSYPKAKTHKSIISFLPKPYP